MYMTFSNRGWLPVYNCTLKVCLPCWLVSNFSCQSLKIVKLAFHWRWIFAFVAGWHVDAPWRRYLNISLSLLIVKWSITVFTQKYWFFFLLRPGHSQKNAFLERANKKINTTLRFSTVYFYRSHLITGNNVKGSWGVGWWQGEIVSHI